MENIKKSFDRKKIFLFLAITLYGFWRVLNRSVIILPVMIVVTLAITFYFLPEQVLSDAINTWNGATIDEKKYNGKRYS